MVLRCLHHTNCLVREALLLGFFQTCQNELFVAAQQIGSMGRRLFVSFFHQRFEFILVQLLEGPLGKFLAEMAFRE